MGGGHAVAFAVHFCLVERDGRVSFYFFLQSHLFFAQATLNWVCLFFVHGNLVGSAVAKVHVTWLSPLERTFRSLCLYEALEEEVEGLAAHLAGEHEEDLNFAGGPD